MSQTLQATYAAKRKARRFAVQGIYEWQMSHNPVHEIEARTCGQCHAQSGSQLLS